MKHTPDQEQRLREASEDYDCWIRLQIPGRTLEMAAIKHGLTRNQLSNFRSTRGLATRAKNKRKGTASALIG